MKNLSCTFAFFLFTIISGYSQGNFDCSTAVNVESFENIEVLVIPNAEGVEDENVLEECEVSPFLGSSEWESQTYWYRYSFEAAGCFTFMLSSDEEMYDLDFSVYRATTNDCSELTSVRCMLSGENVGGPSDEWIRCVGPTGLMEGEVDTEELQGCEETDNNFLAPLFVEAGEVYYLAVKNFSLADVFLLEHSFIENSSCTSSSQTVFNEKRSVIYPNPTNDRINIELQSAHADLQRIELFNIQGQLVNFETKLRYIDVDDLIPGAYHLKLHFNDRVESYKVIKNND